MLKARQLAWAAVRAALALLIATGTASAATAAGMPGANAESGCPAALVVGLHGMDEGPSATVKAQSREIRQTFRAFKAAAKRRHERGAELIDYSYPTVTFKDLGSIADLLPITAQAAGELEAQLESFTFGCPATPISLVGYSQGAWVINEMLASYTAEWPYIKAVELYGDPCWYNPYFSIGGVAIGAYQGLARIANLGCGPASTYPYPASGSTIKVQSLCNSNDPVCGQGYADNDAEHVVQLYKAVRCKADNCSHLYYVASGATAEGGEFLAEYAFS